MWELDPLSESHKIRNKMVTLGTNGKKAIISKDMKINRQGW